MNEIPAHGIRKLYRHLFPETLLHKMKRKNKNILASLQWRYTPVGWKNQKNLSKFHNVHSGQRCFIIGNGPSLKKMDLSRLENEITFGMNRIYLLFNEANFQPTYYVAINDLVVEQFYQDIENLSMPKFVRWKHRYYFSEQGRQMYIRRIGQPSFSLDIRDGAWGGATVTYMAMQLAYYMGFQQVIIIGVDHSFSTKGPAHKEIVSSTDDTNHFSTEYFGKGTRWHLPDLTTSEDAYKLASQFYKKDERSILDATINGKLNIFPKISFETVLSTPAKQPVAIK